MNKEQRAEIRKLAQNKDKWLELKKLAKFYGKQPETLIRNAIEETLRMNGYDVTYHQQGMRSRKGYPDDTAIKNGVTYYIEVKTPDRNSYLKPHQKKVKAAIEAHGGIFIVARCIDDIKFLLADELF
jgi:hypothetical protein